MTQDDQLTADLAGDPEQVARVQEIVARHIRKAWVVEDNEEFAEPDGYLAMATEIVAALSLASPRPSVVGDGLVLVPYEPSEAMRNAAAAVLEDAGIDGTYARAVIRAALAASIPAVPDMVEAAHAGGVKGLADEVLAETLKDASERFARRGDHGGSPGEWLYELMCEIETEQRRRAQEPTR